MADVLSARVHSGAYPFARDVTIANSMFGNRYVRLAAPEDRDVRVLDADDSTTVRVSDEKDLRVLFVQGALTWDYKFIRIALTADPAIRLTGLSRTSTSSVFYQNVEDSDELKDGFPTKIEQLAPFSVMTSGSPGRSAARRRSKVARPSG